MCLGLGPMLHLFVKHGGGRAAQANGWVVVEFKANFGWFLKA